MPSSLSCRLHVNQCTACMAHLYNFKLNTADGIKTITRTPSIDSKRLKFKPNLNAALSIVAMIVDFLVSLLVLTVNKDVKVKVVSDCRKIAGCKKPTKYYRQIFRLYDHTTPWPLHKD